MGGMGEMRIGKREGDGREAHGHSAVLFPRRRFHHWCRNGNHNSLESSIDKQKL